MVVPFGTAGYAVAFDGVTVGKGSVAVPVFGLALPEPLLAVLQGDFSFPEQQHKLFAPLGAVFDFENESHR